MSKQGIREKLVEKVVRRTFNWVTAGYTNSIMDRLIPEIPPHDMLVEEIYHEVMHTQFVETPSGMIQVKKDIRFVGKDKIISYINKLLSDEGL